MRQKISLALGAAMVATTLWPGVANAADFSPPSTSDVAPTSAEAPKVISAEALGRTALPLVSLEMTEWATDTQNQFENDDAFSTVRISDDRKSAEIIWFGAQTPELKAALSLASFPVEVKAAKFNPGVLRRAALMLVEYPDAVAGTSIRSTYAKPDGSGIVVGVDEPAQLRSLDSLSISIAKSAGVPDVPITLEEDPGITQAQGRLDNDVNIGGGRVTEYGSCSTAFTTTRGGASDIRGMMFAAHCGDVGGHWGRPIGGVLTSLAYFGTLKSRQTTRDGAILEGVYYQNAVYIGSYTTDAAVQITGVSNPVLNTEICYSGSYSGTACGSVVTVTNYNYTLGGDLNNITGVRTADPLGYPAAGNGDSGGPGLVPISVPGGVAIYAGTVISGIPTNSPATCQGVPGSTAENGRRCSPIVASTKAQDIASLAGVSIVTN